MKTSVSTFMVSVRTMQLGPASFLLAPLLAVGALVAAFPARAAVPPSAVGATLAVSTDHADATRAALEVLGKGGNAADGAIAAALTLGVVNPSQSGIGGGGFALVYSAKDKAVRAFDFRETAPAQYSADLLWKGGAKSSGGVSGPNGGVVGVPGEPAGLELLSRRYGRKSLAEVAAPAVSLAQRGFWVNWQLAEQIARSKDHVQASPRLAATFLPGGSPVGIGVRVRRPELAATLLRYGAEGKRAIYEGPTAQKIVDAVSAAGGTMTLADLAAYVPKERAPLTRTIGGREIFTMPAPSAGGLMLLEVLGMYGATSTSPLANTGFGSSAYLHTVAEAMRGAFADRARLAGDPDIEPGVEGSYQAALDPAQLAARRARIDPKKTHTPVEFKTAEKGTSHLIVTDAEGNVVTLTTTVNGPFGASIVAGDSGVVLNNELDDFTHPDDVKLYGLNGEGPNRPRAGARPVSSMTPTIVLEGGQPILAVGGSGGARIATGVTQATLARLVFELDPSECVASPRIHTQGVDLLVDHDIAHDVREGLGARGELVKPEVFEHSAVQMIAWSRPGGGTRILAASDPRKAGLSAAK